jgi:hypothetical protein
VKKRRLILPKNTEAGVGLARPTKLLHLPPPLAFNSTQ